MPQSTTQASLNASHLSDELAPDGIITVQDEPVDFSNGSTDIFIGANDPLSAHSRPDSRSNEEDAYESYDTQTPNPDTLIKRNKRGQPQCYAENGDKGNQGLWMRRGSIPIRLEKTEKKGRYILTADDPEVRDIIKRGLERQRIAASAKENPQAPRIRDLVFTRRFTAFDRQNPTNAESPFLGFYVLFWIAMALLLVRVAVQNFRLHGNIVGENQLMRMMFGREVISLGVTDGIMCLSTVTGLGMQILISKDYLDWNRSGWIVGHPFELDVSRLTLRSFRCRISGKHYISPP